MGIFDWFKSAPSTVKTLPDAIWLTDAAKMRGITNEVRQVSQAADRPKVLLIIAFFADCYDALAAQLDELFQDGRVALVMADELPDPTVFTAFHPQDEVYLIAAQRHFLPVHDESLIAHARRFPCRSRVVFHTSLDDTIMRVFGGPNIREMLLKLGMKDTESIRSGIVSRRIAAAQKKFASRITHEKPARTQDEWWHSNVGT